MAAFFKWLWRVNAVLVFLALLALLAAVTLFSRAHIDRPLLSYFAATTAAAKPPPSYRYELEKDLVLGADTDAEDFELYRLVRWGKVAGAPQTPQASAAVNILIVDKKTGGNTWLFAGFNRAIVSQEPILTGRYYWQEPEIDDDIPVEIVVLKVIDGDSNGDGVLTLDDRQTLYIARLPTVTPQKLLSADAIWFTMQRGKTYEVGYREHGQGFLASYALPDFALIAKTKIESMPQ